MDKKTWKGIIQNKDKNGKIIIHDTTITPILDSKDEISAFVSIRRDITQKMAIEQQIRQSQKMEAIGTLAGGIAHDFNNILSGILGYSELAKEDLRNQDCSPSIQKKIDRIVQASLRASDLVGQILTFSRSSQEKPVPIKIRLIAKEVLQFLRASLPSSIKIEQSLNSDSRVMADPTNLHQIFMNLCTNARDAMIETGGILSIRLEDVLLSAKDIYGHEGVSPGKFLCISVEDTGHGMEEEIIEKILEPFFTTKPMGKGTGMGLSLVRGIIKSLNGFMTISSHPGQGTKFQVVMPIFEKTIANNSGIVQETKSFEGNEKILFIDDEKNLAEMTRDILESYGYDVTIFSSSLDALEHFKIKADKYDLIISDITMPDMTGDILVEQIHLISPDVPVILCTGFSERIDEKKAGAMQINALLYKPVPAENMISTIRTILDGENYGK